MIADDFGIRVLDLDRAERGVRGTSVQRTSRTCRTSAPPAWVPEPSRGHPTAAGWQRTWTASSTPWIRPRSTSSASPNDRAHEDGPANHGVFVRASS